MKTTKGTETMTNNEMREKLHEIVDYFMDAKIDGKIIDRTVFLFTKPSNPDNAARFYDTMIELGGIKIV